MFYRVGFGLPWLLVELRVRGHGLRLRAHRDVWLRSLFGLLAMSGYFWALQKLSMVQNTILHLLQPIFVALFSPILVGERIRGWAIVSLLLAAAGAVAALEPARWFGGALDAHSLALLPALAGTGAAAASAVAHIMVRRATRTEPPERVVLYFTAVVMVASGVWALSSGGFSMPSELPLPEAAWKIAGMGGLGLAGQLLMTRAYGRAQAPLVAMVAYTSVPVSMVLDVVAWKATLGPGAILGSVMMIIAGVLLTRARAVTPPNAP
jgi:drug/metabolite transporter (DMT)-like permease